MSQGPTAPDFGTVAPSLASGVTTHSGSALSVDGSGNAILAVKSTGSALVFGLATVPRENGEAQPARFLGPLTLTEDQWDAVTLVNNAPSSGGLVPGKIYVQYTSGKLNTGSGVFSVGDVHWNVGVALSTTTLLILPMAPLQVN